METTIVYRGYIGIMEKKMETTIVYWGYIGVMFPLCFELPQSLFQTVAASIAHKGSFKGKTNMSHSPNSLKGLIESPLIFSMHQAPLRVPRPSWR